MASERGMMCVPDKCEALPCGNTGNGPDGSRCPGGAVLAVNAQTVETVPEIAAGFRAGSINDQESTQ